MKKFLLFFVLLLCPVFALAACSSGTQETTTAALSEEALELSTVTINGNSLVLPVAYADFKEKTGLDINDARPDDVTDSTELEPYSTKTAQFDTSDGIFDILVENRSDKNQKVSDSHIIAIKLMRFYNNDCDASFDYRGVNWDSSAEDIEAALGEPATYDTKGAYHLMGYTFPIDDVTNISVSFVADDEKTDSFAISIDYLSVSAN